MPVYVDDMNAPFGRMIMCHMIADTSAELLTMARRIGVNTRWIQHPGTINEHFDIAQTKKRLAIAAGAIEITWRQAGAMQARLRKTGSMGRPEEAEGWLREDYRRETERDHA